MAITEETRHHLHQRLEEILGSEEAATLMEHLPPSGWADVATKGDLDHLQAATKRDLNHHAVATKGDLDHLAAATKRDLNHHAAVTRGDIDQLRTVTKAGLDHLAAVTKRDIDVAVERLRTELKDEIAELRTETRTGLADVRTEMAQMGAALVARMDTMQVTLVTEMAELRNELHEDRRAGQRQVIGALVVALIAVVVTVAGVS